MRVLPAGSDDGSPFEQEGTCTTPAGETVSFRVNDERGGSGHGVRVFAGARWDPFILDAPAALKTVATGELAFTDPGVDLPRRQERPRPRRRDRLRAAGRRDAGRRRRRDADARQVQRPHRARRATRGQEPDARAQAVRSGQPDLEIRDLYNMEDAFHLADGYQGAYRARLNANLAFWDGLDGKTDWPTNGRRPSADRARARRLPGRRRHQAVRRAGLVPRDRARRPPRRGRTRPAEAGR